MRPSRAHKLQALALLIVLGVPLAGLGGWGAYLHSPLYRSRIAGQLGDVFGLTTTIGRVECIDWRQRRFLDIHMTLPSGREVFRCDWALYQDTRKPTGDRYSIIVRGANFHVDQQDNQEYARLGRRDFASLGVRELILEQASFDIRQQGLGVSIHQADGQIFWIDRPNLAQVNLRAMQINGHPASEAVEATSVFSPQQGLHIQSFRLIVPSLPISAIAVEGLLGGKATKGTFQGRLELSQIAQDPRIDIQGQLIGMDLAEWTQRLPAGPIAGQADVTLDQARFQNGRVEELRCRLNLRSLHLDNFWPLVGLPNAGGRLDLRVSQLNLSQGKLLQLDTNGSFTNVDVGPLAQAARLGWASGKFDGVLTNLTVQDGRLTDLRLLAAANESAPRQVSGELLGKLFNQLLHISLPDSLTSGKLDYEDPNFDLHIMDGQLHLAGQLDPATKQRRPLAHIRLLRMPVPLFADFDKPLDIREPLSRLEQRVEQILAAKR